MKKRTLALLVALMLIFTGCGKDSSTTEEKDAKNNTTSVIDEAEMFTERDYKTEYDEGKSVFIELNGNSVKCESDAVTVSGTTIILSEEGTYVFSGTLDDGQIYVEAEDTDKLQLVLNGASITSVTSAPLYILKADKVFVTLADGTLNISAEGDGMSAGAYMQIKDGSFDIISGGGSANAEKQISDTSAVITGGTFVGTGASGMAQTFSNSKQGVIAVSVGKQSAKIKIELIDGDGKVLISYEPELDFEIVILSSPDIEKGESYTLNIGELSEEMQAN